MIKEKLKKLIRNPRIIVLLIVIFLSIVAIRPRLNTEGVLIKNVLSNSTASASGILPGKGNSKEVIFSINNKKIADISDYYEVMSNIKPNQSIQIKTSRGIYRIITRERLETVLLNETENIIVSDIIKENMTVNGTIVEVENLVNKTVSVPKTKTISAGVEDIGLRVGKVPGSNIKMGLDLQGGTRVLLQPEERVNQEDIISLIDNIKERMNTFGLSDIVVRNAGDLSGNQYILVEIAGATEEDVRELLAKQGKFEAKIGNYTVFVGGRDITYVCRSSECSGIDPRTPCGVFNNEWLCRFRFSISLTQDAAQRQAEATENLQIIPGDSSSSYLSERLLLYLDDRKVDELSIGSELKGKAVTDIQISGSGAGINQQDAFNNALDNMKRLQTILITGSLPIKLNIIQIDNISAFLGKEFVRNALTVGLIAFLSVVAVIFVSYRKPVVVIPIAITMISELITLLGVASLIGWNIDLAAIAGIIIAIGTGVDHQIVITDEALKGSARIYNWKERFKNAFFIIMGTFFTVVVAMFPLLFAGAGLLKGFALTTIIGVSIGVFITRPAYSVIIEILLSD